MDHVHAEHKPIPRPHHNHPPRRHSNAPPGLQSRAIRRRLTVGGGIEFIGPDGTRYKAEAKHELESRPKQRPASIGNPTHKEYERNDNEIPLNVRNETLPSGSAILGQGFLPEGKGINVWLIDEDGDQQEDTAYAPETGEWYTIQYERISESDRIIDISIDIEFDPQPASIPDYVSVSFELPTWITLTNPSLLNLEGEFSTALNPDNVHTRVVYLSGSPEDIGLYLLNTFYQDRIELFYAGYGKFVIQRTDDGATIHYTPAALLGLYTN